MKLPVTTVDVAAALLALMWLRGRMNRADIRKVLETNPAMKQALITAGFDVDAEDYTLPVILAAYAALRLK